MSSEECPSELFDKPRGERRWLGKEHHRGKEGMYRDVKDRQLIEKTIDGEGLSKKYVDRMKALSDDDGLEYNVKYSMNKKNRWNELSNYRQLLNNKQTNTQVIEKNILGEYGVITTDNTLFGVYQNTDQDDQIRCAISKTRKGQHYSNFMEGNREKSDMKKDEKEEKKELEGGMISYNIYKTRKNMEMVGGQMWKTKGGITKGGKSRRGGNWRMIMDEEEGIEDGEDGDEWMDEEEEEMEKMDKMDNLMDYIVEKKEQGRRKKVSESTTDGYEVIIIDKEYDNQLNIQEYLVDNGHYYENVDATFSNQKSFDIDMVYAELSSETGLKVTIFNKESIVIDATKWIDIDNIDNQSTDMIIILKSRKRNVVNVIVNTTIWQHPARMGQHHLLKLISSAFTMKEVIGRITMQFVNNRKIIKSLRNQCEIYQMKEFSDMIRDSGEWESVQLSMEYPENDEYMEWTNCTKVMDIGRNEEWKGICDKVRNIYGRNGRNEKDGDGICSICYRSDKDMLSVDNGNDNKCINCLRNEFYRELSAQRIPIDLKIDNEYDQLYTFIPLPIINLYTRMVYGVMDKCGYCHATLSYSHHITYQSCDYCHYSCCSKCKQPPHWPFSCEEYREWIDKWRLTYTIMKAQGDGKDELWQLTCMCNKCIFFVNMPTSRVQCPKCDIDVNMENMNVVIHKEYQPWTARYRHYIVDGWIRWPKEYEDDKIKYHPTTIVKKDIRKLPAIRKSVIEICKSARDMRLDRNLYNRIRKELTKKKMEMSYGDVLYMIEMVTGWMNTTHKFDRNIRKVLANMMDNWMIFVEIIDKDDRERIQQVIRCMDKDVDKVIRMVVDIIDK